MTPMTDQAKALKIVFAGTPDFAAGHLQGLLQHGFAVDAMYCQPDRKSGRGKKVLPPPTKQIALEHNIAVYQPLNFKDPVDVQALADLKPDVMIVVAYGLLLPQAVLDIPTHGCINVHGSLLPRWRGAAPVERCVEAGDNETGITIMQMDKGLDTGDMLVIKHLPITEQTTGDSLREDLLPLGIDGLIETLNQIADQSLTPIKQDDSLANYASKLSKAEAALDWQQSAQQLALKIRAFTSSNVCTATLGDCRIKVWQAEPVADAPANLDAAKAGEIIAVSKKWIDVACGDGILRLQKLQLPNAKAMDVSAVLNGKRELFEPGTCFV